MDVDEELEGLATATALVLAVILAGMDRLQVVGADQIRIALEGALAELPDDEEESVSTAGFMMETLVELLEEIERDGGSPTRAALRLIRGGKAPD